MAPYQQAPSGSTATAVDVTAAQEQLKIAIVGGSGVIGKRHCQHVSANPATKLVAVVDPSPAAVDVAKQHHTSLYPSIEALLNGPDTIDAAIVCTPNHTHVPLASQLAETGVHVLCEKPISTTVESAQALVTTAQNHNVKLLIGHHRRFNPYMLATKKLLDTGSLGQVVAVNGLWTAQKPDSYFNTEALAWRRKKSQGGGVVLNNFIHEIDLMDYLFGPVTRIHAEKTTARRAQSPDSAEEGAAITLRFASGIVGTFVICDNVPSPYNFEGGTGESPTIPRTGADVYRIFGTRGTLSVPDMILSTYDVKESWEEPITFKKIEVPNADMAPFDSQLNHFVRVCRGDEQPSCTGEAGLQALKVCEAVREALDMDGGGGTVELES